MQKNGVFRKFCQEKDSDNNGKKEKDLQKFFDRNQEKVNKFRNEGSLDHEEILEYKVREAISKINPDSAPGTDGFTSQF